MSYFSQICINFIHKIHPFLVYILNIDRHAQSWNHCLNQDIKQLHHSPDSLMPLPSHRLPPPLSSVNNCLVSVVFPFPECHINAVIQYVAFCVWPLSLNIMQLRSNNTIVCINSLFLFFNLVVFYACICHSSFIHSPVKVFWVVCSLG